MAVLHTTINGEAITADVDPSISLAQFLRDNLYLTGTKIGCGKGECGACTIIMDGKSVTSCIIPVLRAEGAVIQTIEGVAKNGKLHPLQEEFINQGAVQCGFCTPGMIMSAKALLMKTRSPKRRRSGRPWAATSAAAPDTSTSSGRWRPPPSASRRGSEEHEICGTKHSPQRRL